MIIDGHNHLGGPDKGDGYSQSPEELIAKMDEVGIDRAVIFPFNEIDPGISFSLANDRIAKAMKRYPDRLIGFARLDPNYEEKALGELDRGVGELVLRGIKLHPSSQRFPIGHPWVIRIVEKAARFKVPVLFDSGKDISPPIAIGKLAEEVPGATIILGHMRGPNYIEVVQGHENLFLGTADMFSRRKLLEAIEKLGAEKIISGSDSPYIDLKKEVEKIRALPIPSKDQELILGGNMGRILGLK